MLFGNKKKEYVQPEPAEPVVPEVPEEPKFVPSNETVIGKNASFEGVFDSDDTIVIKGKLKGDIVTSKGVNVLGTGTHTGTGKMNSLYVEGTVDGDIFCGDVTKLAPKAQMTGKLSTSKLVTEEGSMFDGSLSLHKEAPKKAEPEAEEAPAAGAAEEAAEDREEPAAKPAAKKASAAKIKDEDVAAVERIFN